MTFRVETTAPHRNDRSLLWIPNRVHGIIWPSCWDKTGAMLQVHSRRSPQRAQDSQVEGSRVAVRTLGQCKAREGVYEDLGNI